MENRFLLNSNECEILLAFERSRNLQDLSELLHKDISGVSRNLKAIADKSPVLEKNNGRWELTKQGEQLNQWTKDAIYSQKLALNSQKSLRIATTREFATRVLLPQTRQLVGDDSVSVNLISSDRGIEEIIGRGDADFGFDCGRPIDPSIAFKQVVKEPFKVVASPKFIKKYKIKTYDDLKNRDLLKFTRTEGVILDLDVKSNYYYGTFSDVSSLREACILGYGWAILPVYTIREQLGRKQLSEVPGLKLKDENYGVWWLRGRTSVDPWVKRAITWLRQQNLG